MKSDYKQRDLILKAFFTTKEYVGGTKRFNHLPLELLELLVLEGHTDHEDRQNDAPSIRELLVIAKQMKEKGYTFSFGGYAVSQEREDYRVSIDTIEIKYYFDNYNYVNNKTIVNFFEKADEKTIEEGYMRFWYD
jgi:hypothetical protein